MRGSRAADDRPKRGAWLRGCAPYIILLTLPWYCVGLTVLEWDQVVWPAVERTAPRVVEWLLSPPGLILLALVLLVLLTEPFHGGLSSAGAGAVSSFDPAGCLIALAALSILVMALLIWLGR